MKPDRSHSSPLRQRRALTIVELLVVLAIIAVLTGLGLSAYKTQLAKAESIDAITKLKGMYAGLASYLVDKSSWPQEPEDDSEDSDEALWVWWKKEMEPYGIHEADWYTTAHLRRLNRELKEAGGKTTSLKEMEEALSFPSIVPTKFPAGPTEPYRYDNQPWVSETGEYHGDDGIYTIMPKGNIHKMMTMSQMNAAKGKSPSAPSKK